MEEANRLAETREAFDSVAAFYDGPFGNNAAIQRMRAALVGEITRRVPPGSRLLDLGCGTGIDAVDLASRGYTVMATDSSSEMVSRTRSRIREAGLEGRARAEVIGIHEIGRLEEGGLDAIYSNLGPLNCVPDLRAAARACATRLRPRGLLVVSVMGRICPWEIVYYAARLDMRRALVRFSRGETPVGLNGRTVWTSYHTPREFYRPFADGFERVHLRSLCLFQPPPYLARASERLPVAARALAWLDERLGAWPVLRGAGDHFLMVLARR